MFDGCQGESPQACSEKNTYGRIISNGITAAKPTQTAT